MTQIFNINYQVDLHNIVYSDSESLTPVQTILQLRLAQY